MSAELWPLPDGRFQTLNGEIVPSRRQSRRQFKRLEVCLTIEDDTLEIAYYDAIAQVIYLSHVDQFGCWVTRKSFNPANGYPHVYVRKPISRSHGVHVVSYRVFKGAITPGNHIDHLCRNKLCWYPEHLNQKTPGGNTRAGALSRRHRTQPPLFYP